MLKDNITHATLYLVLKGHQELMLFSLQSTSNISNKHKLNGGSREIKRVASHPICNISMRSRKKLKKVRRVSQICPDFFLIRSYRGYMHNLTLLIFLMLKWLIMQAHIISMQHFTQEYSESYHIYILSESIWLI